MKILVLFITVWLKTIVVDGKVYTDEDVYITNTTFSYNKIPDDCNLFGAEFSRQVPISNTSLNITDTRTFWIGATVGFKRNINPIGASENCEKNDDGISLDGCIRKCSNYEYISHGKNSCTCSMTNLADDNALNPVPCKSEILCVAEGCVVYQRVTEQQRYSCDTYRYFLEARVALFKFQTCSEKNYGSLCDGDEPMSKTLLTWYQAYQTRKDGGYNLKETIQGIADRYKDGRTYWTSFFRRLVFYWGKQTHGELCVAANITEEGTLTPKTKYCSEQLPVLCSKVAMKQPQQPTSPFGDTGNIFIIIGICSIVILIIGVGTVTMKYNRIRKKVKFEQKIEPIQEQPVRTLDTIMISDGSGHQSSFHPQTTKPNEYISDYFDDIAFDFSKSANKQL